MARILLNLMLFFTFGLFGMESSVSSNEDIKKLIDPFQEEPSRNFPIDLSSDGQIADLENQISSLKNKIELLEHDNKAKSKLAKGAGVAVLGSLGGSTIASTSPIWVTAGWGVISGALGGLGCCAVVMCGGLYMMIDALDDTDW